MLAGTGSSSDVPLVRNVLYRLCTAKFSAPCRIYRGKDGLGQWVGDVGGGRAEGEWGGKGGTSNSFYYSSVGSMFPEQIFEKLFFQRGKTNRNVVQSEIKTNYWCFNIL